MIIMKFGGTSVEDASAMKNVCAVVAARKGTPRLVVLSACAGVTNGLIALAKQAVGGELDKTLSGLQQMADRHVRIAGELFPAHAPEFRRFFEEHRSNLERTLRSLAVLKVLPPQTLDECAAYGELWSTHLVSRALAESGTPATLVDARKVMLTDSAFTQAAPRFAEIANNARAHFLPPLASDGVVVTQGFIGATAQGITTTIGRGGSDYSAAIFGAALDAAEIQIWTDVDGVLSADPTIYPAARHIRELTFNEAAELAYFGAKVLHPSTILPAVEKNIPVRVLNSRKPEFPGTLITRTAAAGTSGTAKSIAYRKKITVITIQSTRMLMGYGFLARVFDIFSRRQKSVDVVVTSEVSISLTVDDAANLGPIVEELEKFSTVQVSSGKAILCVVGDGLKYSKGMTGRIFAALAGAEVHCEMISHGGSEINLTFVIDEQRVPAAVCALHEELFPAG